MLDEDDDEDGELEPEPEPAPVLPSCDPDSSAGRTRMRTCSSAAALQP